MRTTALHLTFLSCLATTTVVHGFTVGTQSVSSQHSHRSRAPTTEIFSHQQDDDTPLQCFVILDDDESGRPPQVVCTADPDDYAWFNGIDRTNLIPTDSNYLSLCDINNDEKDTDKSSSVVDCKQETSHRGFPEWEFQNVGDEGQKSIAASMPSLSSLTSLSWQ